MVDLEACMCHKFIIIFVPSKHELDGYFQTVTSRANLVSHPYSVVYLWEFGVHNVSSRCHNYLLGWGICNKMLSRCICGNTVK